jgi:hypothetical protein
MPYPTEPAVPPRLETCFEHRTRVERRIDRDFSPDVRDCATLLLTRYRAGITWRPGDVKFRVQYQYAHRLEWTPARNFSRERSDLLEANVEFRAGGWRVEAGRIRPTISSGRLVAITEWGNAGRSFDGGRAAKGDFEAFALRHSVSDAPNHQARATGVTLKTPLGQTMLVHYRDRDVADRQGIWTLNQFVTGRRGPWRIAGEAAAQSGVDGPREHAAFAARLEASRQIGPSTSATLTAHWASGGRSAAHSRTFQPMFGAVQGRYGLMRLQSWRNMRHVQLVLDQELGPGANGLVYLGGFWLDDPRDAWYGGSGRPNRGRLGVLRDPTGAAGRHMGSEVAIEFSRTVGSDLELSAGAAVFLPGSGLRRMNGGSASRQWWAYVQFSGRW